MPDQLARNMMRLSSIVPMMLVLICSSCADSDSNQSSPPPKKEQNQSAETNAKTGGENSKKTDKSESNAKSTESDSKTKKLTTVAAEPQSLLEQNEIEDGWIQLFDGATLFGWKANNEVNWSVVDGLITANQGEPGLLLTTVPFSNFELRCDYRLEKGGNSGVFLRSVFNPSDPTVDCYELNMCDTHPAFATASLVGRAKPDSPVLGDGEWHTYHVVCDGPQISVKMDGKSVLDFTDQPGPKAPTSGLIGLQKNEGKIEFRNVFLKPISSKSIFNGNNTAGWHVVPGSESEFVAKDNTIQVKNGLGFLETDGTYADFILQIDAITHDTHLNSGVFFRAMKGTQEAPSHGYEAQIHNGFKDGDRTNPMDWGTGAIFRRQKARRVMADDNKWFSMTLAAHQDHFAVWVNGIQVTDWTDEREPNENPRLGKRLQAGHISLQGHDPTTDLAFRRFRILEYPNQAE